MDPVVNLIILTGGKEQFGPVVLEGQELKVKGSGLSVRMKFKHKKETMLTAEENVWLDANVDLNQEG